MVSGGESSIQGQGPVTQPLPVPDPNLDQDMESESEDDAEEVSPEQFGDLRRQLRHQTRQVTSLTNLMTQITAQLMGTDGRREDKKPRMPTPEKYGEGRDELRAFLTNIELYCAYYGNPSDQEKICTAGLFMKGKAAAWMQPYLKDYLANRNTLGSKSATRILFASWEGFQLQIKQSFGEIDDEGQAEKAITRLKQHKSVGSYATEFRQLEARIDWDDAALRTTFENGLKDSVKDGMVHHDKPEDLASMIELATRIDNRIWERSQQKKAQGTQGANTKKYRQHGQKDKDGDTVMTGQVKNKKKKNFRSDGLTKEERQRRYDARACLGCRKVGHFRDSCPDN